MQGSLQIRRRGGNFMAGGILRRVKPKSAWDVECEARGLKSDLTQKDPTWTDDKGNERTDWENFPF